MSEPSTGRSVALLGAGAMASTVAPHLRSAGWRLRLYNRTRYRAAQLADDGDSVVGSPREAADGAAAVLCFVSDDAAATDVWSGPSGALAGAAPGTLVIESSTVSVPHIEAWGQAARAAGLRPVDAPVTGSTPRARSGSLIAFMGGDPDDVVAATQVYSSFCERIINFGPAGTAMKYKLVHNLAGGVVLVAVAEALHCARALDLPMKLVQDVLSTYGWAASAATGRGEAIVERDYSDHMCATNLMAKDLIYAVDAGRAGGLDLPVARAASLQYLAAVVLGAGDLDMAAVGEAYL